MRAAVRHPDMGAQNMGGESSCRWSVSGYSSMRNWARPTVAGLFGCVMLAMAPQGVTAASAGDIVEELRFGGLAQNIEASGSEDGASINGEALFRSPFVADGQPATGLTAPRPHLGATVNLAGGTSKVYAGLTWELPVSDWLFLEASFGGAVHDGALDTPYSAGEAAYGCQVNFRESASVGFRLDARWSLLLLIDHMSNAGLCARNRGLTNAGLRLGYSLD